jgi:hypothetical protein
MKAHGGVDVESHIYMPSALVGGEWSAHAPAALPLGKKPPRCPLDRRLTGPQSRSGRRGEEKILDPTT